MRGFYYSLVASVAINSLALVSVDRAFTVQHAQFEQVRRQQALGAEKDKIFFDYIEAPQVARPQKPEKARKISNKDSVARDRMKTKPVKSGDPKIKTPGPADQLAQLQAKDAPIPAAALPMQKEIKKMPDRSKAEDKSKEASLEEKKKEVPGNTSKEEVVVPQAAKPEEKKQAVGSPSSDEQKARPQTSSQAGKKQLSGADRITTHQMARSKARGARLSGMTSYDAMGSDMGIYMKNLKEKIWLAWFPYLSFQYPADYKGSDVLISIMLNAKGEVKSVQVLESDGSRHFADFCVQAIQQASGFGAIPQEVLALLGKDQIEIKFSFHYR